MTRTWWLILVCCLSLTLAGLAEPPERVTSEPPVRLKKKKPSAEVTPPAPMPEKKPQPPENPSQPEKKPDDERLDPREQPAMPDLGGDEQEVLDRLRKNTRSAEERLANKELGDATRQVQDDILKDLDALIQGLENPEENPQNQNQQQNQSQQNQDNQQNQPQQNQRNQQNQQQSGGASRQQQPGMQPRGGSQQERERTPQQARRERRKQRQTQTAQRPRPQTGQQPQSRPQDPNPMNPRETPVATGAREKPLDPRFDTWGHLDEVERLKMHRYMEEKFMDKYDELTRQYYRTIAEKSRRKGN